MDRIGVSRQGRPHPDGQRAQSAPMGGRLVLVWPACTCIHYVYRSLLQVLGTPFRGSINQATQGQLTYGAFTPAPPAPTCMRLATCRNNHNAAWPLPPKFHGSIALGTPLRFSRQALTRLAPARLAFRRARHALRADHQHHRNQHVCKRPPIPRSSPSRSSSSLMPSSRLLGLCLSDVLRLLATLSVPLVRLHTRHSARSPSPR